MVEQSTKIQLDAYQKDTIRRFAIMQDRITRFKQEFPKDASLKLLTIGHFAIHQELIRSKLTAAQIGEAVGDYRAEVRAKAKPNPPASK